MKYHDTKKGIFMKKKFEVFPILFLILIFGGTIWSLATPAKEYSEMENRYLAQMPEFNTKTILDGSFMSDYETYISDQFFLRNEWITLKTYIDRLSLKEDSNGVYFGKDDYLISVPAASDYESEICKKNISYMTDFIQSQEEALGAEHVRLMMVPTSSEVLTDKLPLFADPYKQTLLLEQLSEKLSGQTYLSLLPTLLEHKEEPIFYKTDHHWTTLGAFYGYQSWAKSIGLTPMTLEDFSIETCTDSFQGTLQAKVNIDVPADTINLYLPKENIQYELIVNENEAQPRSSLYDYSKLDTKGKYDVFFGGNESTIRIKPTVPSSAPIDRREGNLLVLKDSYANSFLPFAVNHFEQTYVVDLRYFNGQKLSEYIQNNNITDVLVLYSTYNFVSDPNFSKLKL